MELRFTVDSMVAEQVVARVFISLTLAKRLIPFLVNQIATWETHTGQVIPAIEFDDRTEEST